VVRVTVPEPEELFASTSDARDALVGHEAEVVRYSPIVPVALPNLYVSVWVRLLASSAALVIVKPREAPIVTEEESAATVEGGMTAVKDAVEVPTGVFPLKVSQVIVPVL
jgi:hypothetical protein